MDIVERKPGRERGIGSYARLLISKVRACCYDMDLYSSLTPIKQHHSHAIAMFRSPLNPPPCSSCETPVQLFTDNQVECILQQK